MNVLHSNILEKRYSQVSILSGFDIQDHGPTICILRIESCTGTPLVSGPLDHNICQWISMVPCTIPEFEYPVPSVMEKLSGPELGSPLSWMVIWKLVVGAVDDANPKVLAPL